MALTRLMLVAASLWIGFASLIAAGEQTTATWNDGHTSPVSDEELLRYAIASPVVPYPEEARQTKLSGAGLYELRIDKAGTVANVAILKSSGSVVLDKAATVTFRKWRFKPGTFRAIRIPVSWSVNRVR